MAGSVGSEPQSIHHHARAQALAMHRRARAKAGLQATVAGEPEEKWLLAMVGDVHAEQVRHEQKQAALHATQREWALVVAESMAEAKDACEDRDAMNMKLRVLEGRLAESHSEAALEQLEMRKEIGVELAVDNMMASDIETTKVRTHCI